MASDYNYELEREQLTRRRKLADAMLSGSLSSIQAPQSGGPVAARVHPLQAVEKMVQAFFASKAGKEVDGQEKALSQRYNDDLVKGMDQFQQTSSGGTQTTNLEGPQEDGSAMTGTFQTNVPGNRRKAIMDAMASNHPVLKEFAMKQLAEEAKNAVTAKDILPYADPRSIPNLVSQGMAGFKPKRDIREANGTFFNVSDDKPAALGGAEYGEPVSLNGDLYQNEKNSGKLTKLDNAPKINVGGTSVVVDAGKKKGMEHYWQGAADKVKALGEISYSAQNNLQMLGELKNMDAQGIYSNVTTAPATFFSNLAQAVGVPVDPKKLANTENYASISTDLWQGVVSKYGGNRGVTKEEALELKKIVPQAATSPEARANLYRILENISNRQMAQYQKANMAFAKATKLDDPEVFASEFGDIYNPMPNTPQPVTNAPAGSTGVPISLQDYLRSKGVK